MYSHTKSISGITCGGMVIIIIIITIHFHQINTDVYSLISELNLVAYIYTYIYTYTYSHIFVHICIYYKLSIYVCRYVCICESSKKDVTTKLAVSDQPQAPPGFLLLPPVSGSSSLSYFSPNS